MQVSTKCIAVRKVATPLRELTCHMGSHSVTCHPAEVTLLLCFSLGYRHSSYPGLSLFPLLSSTLPGPSASEATALWRYTYTFIIIIIIFYPGSQFPGNEKNYAMQYKKVQKSSWNKPYSSSSFTKQSCSKMALYR